MRRFGVSCAAGLLLACGEQPREVETRVESTVATPAAPAAPAAAAQDSLIPLARAVLGMLDRRDGAALADVVHPQKGLRFSPYPYVRLASDVVIPRDSLARLFTDSATRAWGTADGSGEAISMTFPGYFARFVYDAPFVNAPESRDTGAPIRAGNSPSNLRQVYEDGRWVEFHFKGFDPKYDGMDWRSLWLVFEPIGHEWRLVGIVHGSWTI